RLVAVVPFRDGADLLVRCLDSLEAQRHSLELRVVLADNGSQPATIGAVDRWLAGKRKHEYRLYPHPGAFNFARINNDAVRVFGSDADLVLFLNSDVELVSLDALETLAAHLLT